MSNTAETIITGYDFLQPYHLLNADDTPLDLTGATVTAVLTRHGINLNLDASIVVPIPDADARLTVKIPKEATATLETGSGYALRLEILDSVGDFHLWDHMPLWVRE